MISAEAGITLYNVNYVKKLIRYYYFSLSGDAPEKPVDGADIGSGWSLLEPSYSPAQNGTLYYVDQITTSKGTVKYSEVSKSSGYEAAKLAWEKANKAETWIDDNSDKTSNMYAMLSKWAAGAVGENVEINGGLLKADTILSKHIAAQAITAEKIDISDLFAQNITATGSIKGLSGDFSGKITASEGTIATWTIQNKSIFSAKAGMSCELQSASVADSVDRYAFWAGESNGKHGDVEATDSKLRISQDGGFEQWGSGGVYTYIKSGQITCGGTGELPRTVINKGNARFFDPQYSVTDYLVSIGIITDSSGVTTGAGILPSENTNDATRQINANIGLPARRWTNMYAVNINASGVAHLDGQVWFDGVADSNFQTVQTYAANMYIGSSGRVWKRENSSSRQIKHDIRPLQSDKIKASNLLDVEVIQYKYNHDVIDRKDQRYDMDMPGFIIEDLAEKYPICVDKHGYDSKQWSWNAQFLIPPMLDLIQKQEKRIRALEELVKE